MLDGVWRMLREAGRERFVLPHYHAYVRLNGGCERRVVLPKGKLDGEFVADPFLFRRDDETYLFFEGMYANRGNRGRAKGIVGCLKREGDLWIDCGIVLEEPWHLSFPQVFELEGRTYLIPESGQSGAVTLYECVEFPSRWEKRCDLIVGNCNYVDAAMICENGVFYLAVTPAESSRRPELWMADCLTGPWTRHPQSGNVSPLLSLRRNGGSFVRENDRLYRIAQDCDGAYGKRLFRVPVLRLDRTHYEEGVAEELASAVGWPQPLPYHTYNRVTWGHSKLEVVDRHYYTVKSGWNLISAVFWYALDGLTYFFRKVRQATTAS